MARKDNGGRRQVMVVANRHHEREDFSLKEDAKKKNEVWKWVLCFLQEKKEIFILYYFV